MPRPTLLAALICGLLTALLFALPLQMGAIGFALSTFTATPAFVAALGFGTLAGIGTGVVAGLVIALLAGPLAAAALIAVTVAPAIWMGHLAGLMRDEGEGPEWFPTSGILFRMTLIAAAIAIAFGSVAGFDAEAIRGQMETILGGMTSGTDAATQIDPALISARVDEVVTMLPYAFPVSILLLLTLNFRFAERICRRNGWMLRPVEDYAFTIALPQVAALVFAVAVALSFSQGDAGLVGKAIAGAFGGAFALVGIASVHAFSRALSAPVRAGSLVATWLAIIISGLFRAALAVLGVAETLLGLRARFIPSGTLPANKP